MQSLIVIAADQGQQTALDGIKADHSFTSIFTFESGAARPDADAGSSQRILLDAGLLRRLEFLSDPEELPVLLAPLLVRTVWSNEKAGDLVISYPGLATDRIPIVTAIIAGSCEAVLIRFDKQPSRVIGLQRSMRNERLVAHWAACVEEFSSDPTGRSAVGPDFGAALVSHLCDRIGSIRGGISPDFMPSEPRPSTAPFIREAVRKLLPSSETLQHDPFANVAVLNAPSPEVQQDPGNLITVLAFLAWSARADLQSAFDLDQPEGRRNLASWFITRGPIELDLPDQYIAAVRAARENGTAPRIATPPRVAVQTASVTLAEGVNLIGYPRADMGMGELLRQSAAALSAARVPFSVIDFPFGITASQTNVRFEKEIAARNQFKVNLFHINADQMPLAREKLGPEFFRGHYNIAYWAWELSRFPSQWQSSIDLVDEIWTPSGFVREAIAAATSKPVLCMSEPVGFPEPRKRDIERLREKLSLPGGQFLFLFAFDFSSFANRKNFKGCIEAFRKAFADSDAPVRLVLKTIRHPHQTHEYWDLLREVGDDGQILLIDRILSQTEMRALTAACDAFVSLHRSEGFGFGIAEAMYLGKPVIVTNYSGNTDFTKPDNACLVDYQLVSLRPGEYLFPEGAVWADPDLDQAAAFMRRIATDRAFREELGRAASGFIRSHHSPDVIGARFAKRLDQIAKATELLASDPSETLQDRTDAGSNSWSTVLKTLLQVPRRSR
jgi:glycosyltransferase involved in cell wall biosynthesis